MADRGEQDAAVVHIHPPLVPLLAILAGIGLKRLAPLDLAFGFPAPARYWVGGVIVAAAVLLAAWPIVLFRKSGQSPLPGTPTPRIVEHGPYRFTRNPMYLHMVLLCIGVGIVVNNFWILLLTPLCAWILHRFAILPEETYLERKFGAEYVAYRQRVRRWL